MAITPDMLPLIDLTQTDIDHIIATVAGGVANVQDIYSLSPLQEGILFHHMLSTKGDPYLLIACLSFASRELLDRYIDAVQRVVDRHDILRTGFVWENLSTPAQVVLRRVILPVTEHHLNPAEGPIREQLMKRLDPRLHRIDLTQAPLLRFNIAQDTDGQWILVQLLHHSIGDHSTMDVMSNEITSFLEGRGDQLTAPPPFRNLIAQARLGMSEEDHERFFTEMLADIDTPSLPFGVTEVHDQDHEIVESHRMLPQDLNDRLRAQAKRLGVSLASVCHLAWGLVISRTSGEDRVVFGTVLFGRMGSGPGSDTAMGLFINSLPIRVDLAGGVLKAVLQTHDRLASLLEHELAPLTLAQRCSSVPSGTPLFSSLLNYRHNATLREETQIAPGIQLLESYERTNYPFNMSVEDFGTSLGVTALAVDSVDAVRVSGYMQRALESLAESLEYSPEMEIRQLDVLPREERETLLNTWNAQHLEYPEHQCIHNLFEHQAERTPQATALVFEGQELTYCELNAKANRLAHKLIEVGVKPDTLVAICVERSLAIVISVMAVLKAGGAYVPLDPSYPKERLALMMEDAKPRILLADMTGHKTMDEAGILEDQAGPDGEAAITILNPNDQISSISTNPRVPDLTPRHLAYIIYTSGSTGKPKGVMIEHQGVVNLTISRPESYGISPSSRVLQFYSFSFDGCAMDILSSLGLGASLHLLSDRIRYDPPKLWDYLETHSITQAVLPPAVLQDCTDFEPLNTPLTLTLAGEALPASLLRALQPLIPNGSILNDYGPTETTIITTSWKSTQGFSGDNVPIGRPIANKTIYILDQHLQPVPLGATGEIHIGGVGVARGYLQRPELTAERFVHDPFVEDPEARMYKTGDLARYLPDGNICVLGRNDHQVKIRGFRIELGEIEARLADHPLVQSAIVLASGESRDKRLVAYVAAEPIEQFVQHMRSYLASCLPDYMIPSAIVRLDALPLNPNGKIDRHALPAPGIDAFASGIYDPPQGEIEKSLAQIWAELLRLDRVSRNDNFFALGGHSLLAVRLMNRMAALGLQVPLSELYASPSLAAVAELVQKHQDNTFKSVNEIKPVSREDSLTLSFSQQRLWVLAQLEGVSDTYHVPLVVRFRGDLNREAWQRALNALFERHEALRSVFTVINGEPQVQILPAQFGIPIQWKDLEDSPDVEVELKRICTEEAKYPDYAAWERQWLSGDRLEAHSSYWRTALANAPVLLNLPTDRQRPLQQSFVGDQVQVRLDAQLTSALNRLSQEHGVTMFTTILSAWGAVLSRLS
ncbi:hypothetical protein BGZ65_005707, partial [Modicella reniformis]